jgi:hypothetical protein
MPLSQFLVALSNLEGEARGIPHLAKNERDVGHPAIGDGIGPKNAGTEFSSTLFRPYLAKTLVFPQPIYRLPRTLGAPALLDKRMFRCET